ncbi:MAG: flippase [Candidatus Saccharibacteria bacterium]
MFHTGRNIFSLVLSRVLSGVILFLVYTRLVQYLGPQAAGQFGLLASFLTVFNFFVDLGMSQLVIKKISEDKSHAGKYLTNFFGLQFLLGLVFMLIMDAVVLFAEYPASVKYALYVTAFSLLVTSLSLPFRAVVIAYQKLSINAKINFFNSMINALMMALAIILKLNIFYLSFIAVAVGLFDLLVYAVVVHRKFTPFTIDFDRKFIRLLFVWNLPFMLLTLFSIYNRIDGLLLPHLRNFTENGYYSAAYKFWDTLAYLPGVIGITLYPYFADILSRGLMDEVKKGLETYSRYMIAIAIPMAVGAYLLAKPLTVAFFGTAFLPAAPALWLLVAAVSVLFIYTPANSLIIGKLTKTATVITGLNLLFNLVANLIFIPRYGFVAAAAITLVSETIQFLGYTYFIKRKIVDFGLFRFFFKPIIAAALMWLAITAWKGHNVWLLVAIGGAVYGLALLLLGFFRRSDWEMFKHAVSVKKELNPETLP